MSETTTTPNPAGPDGGDTDYPTIGTLVDAADLTPDDLPDDEREEIQWLTTGGMRFRTDGVWHRLRRPNMGELRKLHEALETLKDDASTWIEQSRQEADRLAHEVREVAREIRQVAPNTMATDASEEEQAAAVEQMNDLTVRLAKLQREQQRSIHQAKMYTWDFGEKWWRTVMKTLRPKDGPPVPKQLPTWVGDAELPGQAIEHWMRVPLGRGGHRNNGR